MSDTAGSRTHGSRDGASVDQLLQEAGMDDDGALRPMLLDLQALAAEQPAPSDAVAALMMPATLMPTGAHPAPTDELAARRRAKRRVALTTLSVAVSLAAGGAVAVASDQGLRDSIGHVNQAVSSFVAAVGGGPAQTPVQTPVPVPAGPGAPATVPTTPSATHAPTAPPGSDARQNPQPTPSPSNPAVVPLPDLRGPGHITPDVPAVPGVPGVPQNGEGLPLPATPPVPLPSPGR
jgi:hypothetical protein